MCLKNLKLMINIISNTFFSRKILITRKMQLNNSDFKRYFKQIILKNIGVNGQKKIVSSKILVIGVGGLGCPLLLYLANSGVKNFGIVDDDKIELSNLNRQVLFTKADLGKYKVSQAKNIIKKN